MANDTNQVQKTLGKRMADLLQREPNKFDDVVFSVGTKKIKVEAFKFVLQAASPVFRTVFDEKGGNGVGTDENRIPLPNDDPTAFKLFVNRLILDSWSLKSIKSLKLSPDTLLNLLGLCRRYQITKAIQNLEEAADDFIQSFDEYSETDEFLKLSRETLETIFSFEKLPLDEKEIFDCASRWADNQCTVKELEPTGENYREVLVLGGCLFQIRFPTMSTEEFAKVCKLKKNFLKEDEQLAIFLFIGSTDDEKTNYDKTQLPFNTNCRMNSKRLSFGCAILSLPSQYKLTSSSCFACDGSLRGRHFKVNEKISLHGAGFLRPIHGDTHFDVTLEIHRCGNGFYTFASGTIKKNIFARKGKVFHFLLDEPIVVESSASRSHGSWQSCYSMEFSLKGTDNTSQCQMDNPKAMSFQGSGVQFHLASTWMNGNPVAELLFRKI